jgi:hypothetical protein
MGWNALGWAARITGLLVAGGFLFLAGAELLAPHSGPPALWREWAGIGLLAAACLSLIPAWRWETAGAAVSLAALAGFFACLGFDADAVGVVAVVALPGVLFLASVGAQRFLVRRS